MIIAECPLETLHKKQILSQAAFLLLLKFQTFS